jgi:hypothetical protein
MYLHDLYVCFMHACAHTLSLCLSPLVCASARVYGYEIDLRDVGMYLWMCVCVHVHVHVHVYA